MTDRPLDIDHLERVAREATQRRWSLYDSNDTRAVFCGTPKTRAKGGQEIVHWSGFDQAHTSDRKKAANAAHIAAFDPPTVLALITRLRAAETRADDAGGLWGGTRRRNVSATMTLGRNPCLAASAPSPLPRSPRPMAELTPEMRAEMRRAATKVIASFTQACVVTHESYAASQEAGALLALLDYCDRLERERDEARENANSWEACTHQLEDQCEEEHRTAESAFAAAHERMREMAEALGKCIPFVQAYEGYVDVGDEDGCRTWQAVSTAYGTAARVLADYRKGNADG